MRKTILGLVTLVMPWVAALAQEPLPTSVYFAAFAQSDALGDWKDYVLDLRPSGGEVLVRSVWMGQPNPYCSRPIIAKGHESFISREVYEELFTEANPCAVKPKKVERAMRQRRGVDLMEHPVNVLLVADCSGERRELWLPHLGGYRKPKNSKVAKLRGLYWDVQEKLFPNKHFGSADLDEDFALQESAQPLMSDLRSGQFDYWIDGKDGRFKGGWGHIVDGYRGPVRVERSLVPKLLPTELTFVDFVAPGFPPLAASARVQGTVRLDLELASDGSVLEARLIEGHPMLAPAALEAAPSWRVDPSDVPSEPVEVGIEFGFNCAE